VASRSSAPSTPRPTCRSPSSTSASRYGNAYAVRGPASTRPHIF
jgi:hypothetical protein